MGPGNQTQISGLGGKHLLSGPPTPFPFFKESFILVLCDTGYRGEQSTGPRLSLDSKAGGRNAHSWSARGVLLFFYVWVFWLSVFALLVFLDPASSPAEDV